MKLLRIEGAALVALIICIFVSTYNLDKSCENIRENVLRLHIIAASDEKEDQEIKLSLRDELLSCGKEIFSLSKSKSEAEAKIRRELELVEKTACDFLEKTGCGDKAEVRLEKCFFPTRRYDGYTLPAGYYDALKVVIGEGKGQNWWCVMFPSLCLPAAREKDDVFDGILSNAHKQIITEEKYELRLWFVEKWQEIKNMYNN